MRPPEERVRVFACVCVFWVVCVWKVMGEGKIRMRERHQLNGRFMNALCVGVKLQKGVREGVHCV